jgi:hypothetical protein
VFFSRFAVREAKGDEARYESNVDGSVVAMAAVACNN